MTYGARYLNLTNDIVAEYRAIQGPLPTLTFPPGVRYFPETGHILQRASWPTGTTPPPPGPGAARHRRDGADDWRRVLHCAVLPEWLPLAMEHERQGGRADLVTLTADDWSREPD